MAHSDHSGAYMQCSFCRKCLACDPHDTGECRRQEIEASKRR